jgi:hypothetical protein
MKSKDLLSLTINQLCDSAHPISHDNKHDQTQEHTPTLPSGKRLHNYGKSPFSMGKSTINHNFQ